ncbi:unnamed protein product [Urochloa decumbens]|uniref:Ionotropic glutamate receptor C-terminal domain-containing protein n=1 Tax=Urochloa decumbens TaxID=240449 RepID=A0ABC9DEH5_9POAL
MEETDLGRHCVSATRIARLDSIHNISFDGLARKFELVNGELQLPSYEIANHTSKAQMGVGLWIIPLSLLPQNLSLFDNSRSGSGTIEPVFWREDPVMTSKGREKIVFPLTLDPKPSLNPKSKRRKLLGTNSGTVCGGNTNEKPLRIGVPKKDGFKAFVNVSDPYFSCKDNVSIHSITVKRITGYSIDVFETAMKQLKRPLSYELCVFDGSYDELVGNVSSGKLDGAAGDVTITTDRIGEVAFTMPYTQPGVSLLVLSESETIQWTFLEPMTKGLWLATLGFIFFTGFVVWAIEKPRNPEYQGSVLRQFNTALYFAFSTVTFSHGHIIRSPMSRIVVVTWCFVMLVLAQSYTACFSSNLTANRLRPVVTLEQLLLSHDKVGYQNGSFVYSMLINRGFNKTRLIPYTKEYEYAEGLKKGSKQGGVSGIVDEVPYLTAFLADPKYKKQFRIVRHVYNTPGFGFVFNLNSCRLVQDLSAAIVNITGGNQGSNNITEKWLGRTDAATPAITQTDSTALTLQNFSGHFIISGAISSLMLFISIMRLAHAKWTAARDANAQAIDITPGSEESRRLQQDATGHTCVLAQPHPEPEATTTNSDSQGGHRSGGSSVRAEESRLALKNEVGNNSSVRGELPNEAMSNDLEGGQWP